MSVKDNDLVEGRSPKPKVGMEKRNLLIFLLFFLPRFLAPTAPVLTNIDIECFWINENLMKKKVKLIFIGHKMLRRGGKDDWNGMRTESEIDIIFAVCTIFSSSFYLYFFCYK